MTDEEKVEGPAEPSAKRWLAPLLVLAGLAVAAVLMVLLAGSGGQPEVVAKPAPPDCVAAWNEDRLALGYARHNRTFHNYAGARVARLADAVLDEGLAEGDCAVVFPNASLDPEPDFAGYYLRSGNWLPLAQVLDLGRLDELQSEAVGRENTILEVGGELTPATD